MIDVHEQYRSLLYSGLEAEGVTTVKGANARLDKRLYDPNLPTLAVYGLRAFEGVELLAVAADRLKKASQPSINVVVAFPGTFAEEIVPGPDNTASLFLRHGWTISGKRKAKFFDLEQPIAIDAVEHGQTQSYQTPTAGALDNIGVPMLRQKEAYALDSKITVYERANATGIAVPAWMRIAPDGNPSIAALQKLTSQTANSIIVIKPSKGMQGNGVIFLDLAKLSQGDVDYQIAELQQEYTELVASEYIEPLPLSISNIEKAAWNLRVIGFNGFCGAFVRAHKEFEPGNHERGASLHLMQSLKKQINERYGDGFYDQIASELSRATTDVCGLAPNTALGLDFIIDRRGKPVLIEVNVADFGALATIDKIDRTLGVKAAELMVQKLVEFLPRPKPASAQASGTYSIYDATARAYNRLLWESWETYHANPKADNDPLTDHRKSLEWLVKLCIEDIHNGDHYYAAAYLLTLDDILGEPDPEDELFAAIQSGISEGMKIS